MKIFMTALLMLLSSWASGVEAACTGSSPTWNTTPDEASVQICANNASVGDTIRVGAGSATWTTGVTIPSDKNLVIQGAGIDQTTITSQGNYVFNVERGNKRITGFTFILVGRDAVVIDGDGWRVDHIKAVSAGTALTNGVHARGTRADDPNGPTGLVDNVEFINSRVLVMGYPAFPENSGQIWSSPLGLGDMNAVYVEDSTITRNAAPNAIDCNDGGRYVLRFTTVAGTSLDAHSAQGGRRGCRRWEVYNVTMTRLNPYFTPVFIRAGAGVIFNNTMGSGWSFPFLTFDNRRSFQPHGAMGQCDGTSAVDGNQIPAGQAGAGWPCRDQIGWAQDSSQWTSANPHPIQLSTPAYFWNNTIGELPATVNIANGSGPWIQANRDYYNHAGGVQVSPTSPFNGTSGVGVGTVANRPPTCTSGVAYWATDEGEWNSLQAGADGQLYKCTATNTWSLYYRPFHYPHPLQNTTGTTSISPSPPQNLIIH